MAYDQLSLVSFLSDFCLGNLGVVNNFFMIEPVVFVCSSAYYCCIKVKDYHSNQSYD